jgi:hypothetical protein
MEGRDVRVTEKLAPSVTIPPKPPSANILEYRLRPGNPFTNPELIIEQWTGFADLKGTPIYAGDIIQSAIHSPTCYAIVFIEGGFCATNPAINGYPIDINHFESVAHGERLRVTVVGHASEDPKWRR